MGSNSKFCFNILIAISKNFQFVLTFNIHSREKGKRRNMIFSNQIKGM